MSLVLVRLELRPFGVWTVETQPAAVVEWPIELSNGATYSFAFTIAGQEGDTYIGRLSSLRCVMPPRTIEADPLQMGAQARPPMPHAADEADQRRKEWAARGVTY